MKFCTSGLQRRACFNFVEGDKWEFVMYRAEVLSLCLLFTSSRQDNRWTIHQCHQDPGLIPLDSIRPESDLEPKIYFLTVVIVELNTEKLNMVDWILIVKLVLSLRLISAEFFVDCIMITGWFLPPFTLQSFLFTPPIVDQLREDSQRKPHFSGSVHTLVMFRQILTITPNSLPRGE